MPTFDRHAVVAIDMDKNKPTNADKPVRKGGAGFGVSESGSAYTLNATDRHAVAYAIDSMGSNAMKSRNPTSGCREVECAPTLTTVDSAPVKHQGGVAVVGFLHNNSLKAWSIAAGEEVSPTLIRGKCNVAVSAECVGVFDMNGGKTGARTDTSGASPTILAAHGTDTHAVCIGLDRASFNQGQNAKFGFTVEEECAPTVVSKGPGAVSIDYIVRLLTPLECERLQGLPDGYTLVPYRGKPAEECPDSPRYKALGNGWAVNCARWISQRIQARDNICKTTRTTK